MLLILVLTGGFGFFASWSLLELGISALWIRYPLAVVLAYGVFLLLLRLWLAYQRRRRGSTGDSVDLSDLLDPGLLDVGGGVARGAGTAGRIAGGGGRFGGAGASGSYQGAVPLPVGEPQMATSAAGEYGSSGAGDAVGSLFDLAAADEGTIPILVVVLILAAAFSLVLLAGYVVWIAPALLAELLVDGLVVAALSHRLHRIDSPSWTRGVLRRTWLPAAGMALLLGFTGYVFQRLDPSIRSIGDIVSMFTAS